VDYALLLVRTRNIQNEGNYNRGEVAHTTGRLLTLFLCIAFFPQQDFKEKLDPELAVIPKAHIVFNFADATDAEKKLSQE
jgi:hypothetical protein